MTERLFNTALIIEPSLIEQRRLRQAALRAGIERVLIAEDGARAATVMGAELVDIVLMPWKAEGRASLDLLRALRKLARNRRVPVVLLDDGMQKPVIVSAVKAGVSGRLQLPAQPEELRKILAGIAAEERGEPRTRAENKERDQGK